MARKKQRSTQEKQTLILWALLAREDGTAFQNELKPVPQRADREALEAAGLIKSTKSGRYGRIRIEVTDKGWDWAGKNLSASLPANSNAGTQILQAWLTKLHAFMAAQNFSLANILAPQVGSDPCAQVPDYTTLRERIRKSYLDLTGGQTGTRALLRDVRAKLKDIEPTTLDEALKRMQRENQASLYPLDNRIEITEADHAAAIYFGSEPRHILWIER